MCRRLITKRSAVATVLAGALMANMLVLLPIAARADDDKDGKKIIIIVRPPTKTHDGKLVNSQIRDMVRQ